MSMTHLYHSRTGCYASLVVLPLASVPTIPGVRARNHPAFLQRREALCALWPCLHVEAPSRTMCGHPRVEVVVVILHIRNDRASPITRACGCQTAFVCSSA